jgi:hypothetical protein
MTTYKPCVCGGLVACYCGQRVELAFWNAKDRIESNPFQTIWKALGFKPRKEEK